MKDSEIFAQITWTRQDIRQLLEDNGLDSTEEVVDRFLERLDLRRFEEACIEDGWERLAWVLTEQNWLCIFQKKQIFSYCWNKEYNK